MNDGARHILTTTLLSACLLPLATSAMAQTTPVPPPASKPKWSVRVAPGRCTLSRSDDTDVTHAAISLDTLVGSDSYRFSMAGANMADHAAGTLFPVTIVFHDTDRRFDGKGASAPLGAGLRANSVGGLGEDFLTAFAQASSVSFEGKALDTRPFPLPDAKAAARAFTQCMTDQLIDWGADPTQFAPGGKKPVELKGRDYWLANVQLLELPIEKGSLDARFRVSVAPNGTVDACSRIDTDGKDEVEKLACAAVLTKRLFTPATGPDGKPVRGVATFEVQLTKQSAGGGRHRG